MPRGRSGALSQRTVGGSPCPVQDALTPIPADHFGSFVPLEATLMTVDHHAVLNARKTVTELAGGLLDPIGTLGTTPQP
ncbi:hypothetical protein [Deinococcus humi]|uniref:Uncharacterized protein n=1 Tax=Deinococcus humi TaxID=662880 RepID=A0A7W8JXQ5_9DEIO|nr:hypothetical protein [Deinococcus humi]MBB5363903.1 hypothetical protein [Deinococcus humi]GGO31578.1 hypothetical protein GCM10008949_27760 [Deinococcus humi]